MQVSIAYLGPHFSVLHGSTDYPMFHVMNMYMSLTEQAVKDMIVNYFTCESQLRTVVAFGNGKMIR